MYKENGLLKDSKAIKEADRLLSSKKESRQSKRRKGQSISLDSFHLSASQNSTTNQPKNQEKPSKLDEAMEEGV